LKGSSVNALLVLSIVLLVPGAAIISPDGRLFVLVIAGICAITAVIGGKSKGKRIAAILILAAVLGLALSTYSEHRTSPASYDKYKEHSCRK
jgi:hypothetical protein